MSDSFDKDHSNGKDKLLSELRHLLVGPEQEQIGDLMRRLNDPQEFAEELSRVLPQAVALRNRQDDRLTRALQPTVETALTGSVKRNPRVLVDAIFPVLGPAIRKAVAAAFRGMIESLNETLNHSFSARGLKWRMEAIRTGKSFGEIVLSHSLIYRVEQVFLIHKPSGILLQHVGPAGQDSDMISGMLTAIQDFVRDSFNVREGETLETMRVGELNVLVEQGPHAILAGVIRGTSPEELRAVFQDAIENVHMERLRELETFEGDPAPFETVRPHLEVCLQAQFQVQEKGKASPRLKAVLVALLLLLGVWAFFVVRDNLRWSRYINRLKSEPGIVVTSSRAGFRSYAVSGLRDPLAVNPEDLLESCRLRTDRVSAAWQPFQALHPRFIEARAEALLNPPADVVFKLRGNVLVATGTADEKWIERARLLAPAVAGVQRLDDRLLNPGLAELQREADNMEAFQIRFIRGRSEPIPGQEGLEARLVEQASALLRMAQEKGRNITLEVTGHTDQEGSEELNQTLSRQRAEYIVGVLVTGGFPAEILRSRGAGSSEPLRPEAAPEDRELNRRVSFKVRFTEAP